MLKFTDEHEWLLVDGDSVTVGITDYAQKALGDVVFVEMPEVGDTVSQGDDAGVVESVKAASELYAPIGGDITAANEELEGDPSLVNSDPMGAGWFFKMSITDMGEVEALMDEAGYKAFIAGLE